MRAAAALPWGGMTLVRTSPVARIALGVTLVLALPFVGSLVTNEVDWSPFDFVVAGLFLAVIGVALELVARRAGGRLAAVVIGAIGALAAVWGKADDAPGLVLLGLVLLGSAGALVVRHRTAGRS